MSTTYTWDEVEALRKIATEEILDEMQERFGMRQRDNVSESFIEDRVKTYIIAGLKHHSLKSHKQNG